MRKIPSFLFCAVTMTLFIGPALLSVGIPMAPRTGEASEPVVRPASGGSVETRDAESVFEALRPSGTGWRIAADDAASSARRIRLVRDRHSDEPAFDVVVDFRRGEDEATPMDDAVQRIEGELLDEFATPPAFSAAGVRFAGHDAMRIEATGRSAGAAGNDVSLAALVIPRRRSILVITARADDSTLASARAALDLLEHGIRLP